jgi:hypothetical protein
MVFLFCPQNVFTPENPGRTLSLATHVLYAVVHIRDSVFYLDRLEVLCNYVVMEPMFLKIACPYVGTYIRFSQTHDTEEPLATISSPSFPNQQQLNSSQQRSSHQPNRPSSLQQRPSANASSSSRSTVDRTGNQRAAPRDSAQPSSSSVPQTDYDSDDSQVKKKTKVAELEWQGQTFYVTGKKSAFYVT